MVCLNEAFGTRLRARMTPGALHSPSLARHCSCSCKQQVAVWLMGCVWVSCETLGTWYPHRLKSASARRKTPPTMGCRRRISLITASVYVIACTAAPSISVPCSATTFTGTVSSSQNTRYCCDRQEAVISSHPGFPPRRYPPSCPASDSVRACPGLLKGYISRNSSQCGFFHPYMCRLKTHALVKLHSLNSGPVKQTAGLD